MSTFLGKDRSCRLALALCLTGAIPLAAAGQTVTVVETTADQTQLLQTQPSLVFDGASGGEYTITVSSTLEQPWDGVGGELTDSGAWLIYDVLTESQRNSLLNSLFSPPAGGGVGFNILRTGMSGSGYDVDPATGEALTTSYTYDDLASGTDLPMADFSTSHDDAYIIPVLQQILSLDQDLEIFAVPFSPPAWMKTSDNLDYGNFNTSPSYEQSLSTYIVDYLNSYSASNIPIYGVAIQNEPDYASGSYPGELLAASDEANIINYLGPALTAAHFGGTKILGWDHNWSVPTSSGDDGIAYPETLLGDSTIYPYMAGTSYHCYGGTPSVQTTLHNAYPDMDIWDLECAGGSPGTSWASWFAYEAGEHLFPEIQNWGRSHLWWTLAQDQNFGPEYGNCSSANCSPIVTINTSTDPATITYQPEYYILAQFSDFVRPGAYVVNSSGPGIGEAAFRNQDGSYVVVAYNGNSTASPITVAWNGTSFNYSMDPNSIATFTWSSPSSSSMMSVNDNTTGSGSNQFNYSGSWDYWGPPNYQANAYENDNHWSGNEGDYYTLTFNGTQALVYASRDIWDGYAGFSVDGGSETDVDLYSPGRVDNTFLWATPLLSSGTHTIKVRVTGNRDSSSQGTIVPADRIDVSTATPTTVNDNTTGTGQNQFNYVGSWSYNASQAGAYDSDNHWSSNPGDYYTLWFVGTRAIIYGSKDVWDGWAAFSVDHGEETMEDLYNSSRIDDIPLWATPILPYGAHGIKVRVTGRSDPASGSDIVPADRIDVITN